jgi:hypothetical protein
MGNPEVKWSIVSSCCLRDQHLLSISSFKMLFLKELLLLLLLTAIELSISGSSPYTSTDKRVTETLKYLILSHILK